MTVVIATGNAILDNHIKTQLDSTVKVNYLEELLEINGKVGDVNLVILSAYLPSIHDDSKEKESFVFQNTVKSLINENIRIIYLTDMYSSYELLEYLLELGVYDFIISENGDVHLEEILDRVKNPATKEEAQELLEALKPKKPIETEVQEHSNHIPMVHQYVESKKEEVLEPLAVKDMSFDKPEEQPYYNQKSMVRSKLTDKENKTVKEDPKLFSFWSSSPNVGKRTLSQSFAMEIAKQGYSVLYVEFDYHKPTLALTTALTNEEKNFYQLSLSQDNFDIRKFIANKMDVRITKDMLSLFNKIPEEFHFLALPAGFNPESFPSITNDNFLDTIIMALKDIDFDAVVINLPNQIDDLFCFPVMLESDVIFSITTCNPVRIREYRKSRELIDGTLLDMNKWKVIVNQVNENVPKDVCDSMLKEKSIMTVPYDPERQVHELDLLFGSPLINEKMKELINIYGFYNQEENKNSRKKGLFGLIAR